MSPTISGSLGSLGSSIMFNTGDIVSWREDGSLDTFGRKDDQVKIKVHPPPHANAYLLFD